MAFEKSWKAIPPRPFTANGTVRGEITIADTVSFKVKQQVILSSTTQPDTRLEIKRVLNSTTLIVGPISTPISTYADVSAFTVVDGATIRSDVQPRSSVPEQEIERLTYDEEPTVARRVVLVDPYGDYYTLDSPLPVDAVLNVDSLDISLDAKTGDNIAISGHPNSIFAQNSAMLTLPTYQQVFTYTSTNLNTKIVSVIASISTTANAVLKINGTIIRKYRTSPMDRQATFIFYEHRPLPIGAVLTLEVQPDRMFNAPFEAFVAMEGYIA